MPNLQTFPVFGILSVRYPIALWEKYGIAYETTQKAVTGNESALTGDDICNSGNDICNRGDGRCNNGYDSATIGKISS